MTTGRSHPYLQDSFELPTGRKIGYAEYGDPDGDTIFWFHGTPGARLQVPPATDREGKKRGLRIISVERPGNGSSTPFLYDRVRDITRDLAALADDRGAERFGIIGLSGGGPYTLACAHDLPDRVAIAVVLGGLGPTQGSEAPDSHTSLLRLLEWPLLAGRGMLAKGFSRALAALVPVADQGLWAYMNFGPPADRPAFKGEGMADMFKDDMIQALGEGLRGPVYDLALFSRHWGFKLANISVPVHFWQGDADVIVPFNHGERQSELVPNATLFRKEGEGHFAGFTTVHEILDQVELAWTDRVKV